MSNHVPVGVIGAGSWGTTIAHLISQNGVPVRLWMRNAERAAEINETHRNSKYSGETELSDLIVATTDLQKVVEECACIFFLVTSASAREVLHEMGNYLTGSHILVHGIKGFEHATFKRISTLILEETCCRKIGVLSGPNLAGEILSGHPSATVIASRFPEVVTTVQDVLISPVLRVYGHRDVTGVEVAGALKNIIALAAGMSNGFGFQNNTQSLLMTRGLVEMTRFGLHLGAEAFTFRGLAGMGDLIATCSSTFSRNYQVGHRIAQGETLENILNTMSYVSEGVPTTRSVARYSQEMGVEMPITQGVCRILFDNVPPREAIKQLMIREYKYEEEFSG